MCGWPQHLLFPKGTEDGYPFRICVVISDYKLDKVLKEGRKSQKKKLFLMKNLLWSISRLIKNHLTAFVLIVLCCAAFKIANIQTNGKEIVFFGVIFSLDNFNIFTDLLCLCSIQIDPWDIRSIDLPHLV